MNQTTLHGFVSGGVKVLNEPGTQTTHLLLLTRIEVLQSFDTEDALMESPAGLRLDI